MNFIKKVERINKTHHLVCQEKTGSPFELACILGISRSQLYNIIDMLKENDAPIKYSKKRTTFYYEQPFDLELKYSLKIITDEETKEIFGGLDFRPIILDGSLFPLQ
ncbi:hypothetical protein [Flavobacterium psychrotolerans]|uniref:DNA-binding protein n=1 Tax=Flavobacterium psychrotolerans TaxID=2169410 RepID=A0A2U1JGM6_9FLAO|nr:hypothetical protein [Flavobacterium psychrotolerans]PWA04159.1 hypothetical protein DB895_12310 [Flavobacterium psychrotolerans]